MSDSTPSSPSFIQPLKLQRKRKVKEHPSCKRRHFHCTGSPMHGLKDGKTLVCDKCGAKELKK